MSELVVLVDEQNSEIGTADKNIIHTADTPLHRGFSLFLFNSKKELLLTKRAKNKKTFPGVWTNTVCGHPGPGENVVNAAKRRLKDELGIRLGSISIQEITPYRYRFTDVNGVVENEICPILVAYAEIEPKFNFDEIDDWKWISWNEFLEDIKKNSQAYSPWSVEEAHILQKLDIFNR
ncbi:isopentenyl-diphosphate Delta-isomerase [Candidatus Gottesmanbacteria bacterium]|nr:isopentenyl-diphosphate Delta-isomerase [Candidatus Gottesmanbacteria bacterium]